MPNPDAIRAAGALIFDEGGRILLIMRARAPGAMLWSIPGGRLEPGESAERACVREVREEVGLCVQAVAVVEELTLETPEGAYAITELLCELAPAGQHVRLDAHEVAEIAWADLASLEKYALSSDLRRIIWRAKNLRSVGL